jgi:hypothetical protein
MDKSYALEEQARTETFCRGCGGEKEDGLIVCWPCFKYREDIVPYKEFNGTFEEWLQRV